LLYTYGNVIKVVRTKWATTSVCRERKRVAGKKSYS